MAKDSKVLTVQKEEFGEFLNGISLRGSNLINFGIFDISEKSVDVALITNNKGIGIVGKLDGKFVKLGKIGIDDFSLLKNSLQLIGDKEVAFNITDNKLTLKTKNAKVNLVLRDLNYLKNSIPDDKITEIEKKSSGNEFTLKYSDIQEITKYCNLVKPKLLNISYENKLTIFGDNNDNQFELNLETDEIKPFSTKVVSEFLLDVFSTIKTDITISIVDNLAPIQIKSKNGNIAISYFVVPTGE